MPYKRGVIVFAWLYRKIFVSIVPDGGAYDVVVAVYKNKKRLEGKSKRFEGEDGFERMSRFILSGTEESPLHYIAVLNPDPHQGAVEGCTLHDISEEGDISGAKTLCRNNKWLLYASLRELDHLKKQFSPIGLDYIFSPFSVLEHFFKDKTSGALALYALAQKDSLSVAFFDEGKLVYGHHYPMRRHEGEGIGTEDNAIGFAVGIEEEELDGGINLDDIESLEELDIIDELDELGDIEDLDAFDELSEFSEEALESEEKKPQSKTSELKEGVERFGDDYSRFELIQKALARFYGGGHCHHRFIETVYVADAYGSGTDLKYYLEEELFLNVLIRKIDIAEEVLALSVMEEAQ